MSDPRRVRASSAPLPTATGRNRSNARGDATRERILVTAERLFAERGIEAVPLRDIGIAAGQRNNVAVQYHFGDRETLVREVAAYRSQFVVDIQDALLGETRPTTAGDHVRAFVYSLAKNIDDRNHYLPFLSRYMIERGGYAGLEHAVPAETIATLTRLLHSSLPDLPDAVIDERWQVMFTSVVHTLARYQSALAAGTLPAPKDEVLEDLVAFMSAGLVAPIGADLTATAAGRSSS